ncbi:MAG: hypothetical protein FJY97_13115 [candidate division Zixibacteria bacterium]|nr:hypothetical protein [candidate division Zixibacteria bacterium]
MRHRLFVLFLVLALDARLPVWSQEMTTPVAGQRLSINQPIIDREAMIRKCLEQLQREAYDSVLANSVFLREQNPDDPVGYFLAADTYHTMMRDYRVPRFEAQFHSLIRRTIQVAQKTLKRHPTAQGYFLLGSAEGYRCLHLFRRGQRLKAIKSAMTSVAYLRLAHDLEPDFADPLLGLALYDYTRNKIPALGWFISGKTIATGLERVEREGRYISLSARYARQVVYFETGDIAGAWTINEWLYQRYPHKPGCLYNRALLLERMNRPMEAIPVWQQLIARIEGFGQPSNGYLAECHYRLAVLWERTGALDQAETHIEKARAYATRYRSDEEMDGPYVSFEETSKAIAGAIRENEKREIAKR